MPAGSLHSAYAYEVSPRQTSLFEGGTVTSTPHLQTALDEIFDKSSVSTAPAVSFEVDSTSNTRKHPIRDEAIALAFTAGPHDSNVVRLVQRLALSMDNRSRHSLFIASVHQTTDKTKRRVLFWTFPRQQVFNMSFSKGVANLQLIEAFNRESHLRKVAFLEGSNTQTSMLSARILDFQATSSDRGVADLWITKFLQARLQMSSAEGTQLLANSLRSAHGKLKGNQLAQDQITAAIESLRVTKTPQCSLESVSKQFLDDPASAAFKSGARPEELTAVFTLDIPSFEQILQYKRFVLDNGIVVSAPFGELSPDGGAKITQSANERRLRVEGLIEDEQVRSRV